jgi:hypothetical protein
MFLCCRCIPFYIGSGGTTVPHTFSSNILYCTVLRQKLKTRQNWSCTPVLQIGIRCFFTSGIRLRDEFFPDLGSRIRPLVLVKFSYITVSSESLLCYLYETGLLLKLTRISEPTSSKTNFLTMSFSMVNFQEIT